MFLVSSSMRSSTLRAIPVTDLRAQDQGTQSMVGQRLRVVGFVGAEPVRKTAEESIHGKINVSHFAVVEGPLKVQIAYPDTLPDTFRKGGPVQVDGLYMSPGVMRAERVLTKCPSKYEVGEEPSASQGKKLSQAVRAPAPVASG